MKKIIQALLIAILLSILALIIIAVFNPFNLRTKMVSNVLDSYLSSTIENYESLDLDQNNLDNNQAESSVENTAIVQDKNPLLSDEQEKTLENFGVDVTKLPTEISPEMQACFFEKLGEERGGELVNGAIPGPLDLLKVKDCIGM